jgi:hypothetical protein
MVKTDLTVGFDKQGKLRCEAAHGKQAEGFIRFGMLDDMKLSDWGKATMKQTWHQPHFFGFVSVFSLALRM